MHPLVRGLAGTSGEAFALDDDVVCFRRNLEDDVRGRLAQFHLIEALDDMWCNVEA